MYKLIRFINKADDKRPLLIMAAAVITMTAAACFFYLYGNNETISIQTSAAQQEGAAGSSEITERRVDTIYVDIAGCVKDPGVYEMPYGSRVFEVIDKAGGFTKHADTALINQAEPAEDGMKINVPDKRKNGGSSGSQGGQTAAGQPALININTADSEELQKIPGIGPVTADKIIQYRESNGAFHKVEDITNVSGIGDKTLEKMRPMITV